MRETILHSKLNSLSLEELDRIKEIPKGVYYLRYTGNWRVNYRDKHILHTKDLQTAIKALNEAKRL